MGIEPTQDAPAIKSAARGNLKRYASSSSCADSSPWKADSRAGFPRTQILSTSTPSHEDGIVTAPSLHASIGPDPMWMRGKPKYKDERKPPMLANKGEHRGLSGIRVLLVSFVSPNG